MARLEFNFHARSARPGRFGIALALAGAVALGWAWNALQAARATEAGLTLQIAALELEEPRPNAQPAARRDDDTQARIAAQLAYSWQPAFDALAAAHSKKIALVSLEAAQTKSQLRLIGEARQLADAVDFIDALQQQPAVKRSVLIQHEVLYDDAQQPVRFSILVDLNS